MNFAMIMGITRHVLTTLGGAMVAKGYTDSATLDTVIGGATAALGVVWSIYEKVKAAKK
jgi:hypothetical protein